MRKMPRSRRSRQSGQVTSDLDTRAAHLCGTSSILPAATFGNRFPNGLIPPIGHNSSQLSVFEGQSISSPFANCIDRSSLPLSLGRNEERVSEGGAI